MATINNYNQLENFKSIRAPTREMEKKGGSTINVNPDTGVITTNTGSIQGNPSNIYDPLTEPSLGDIESSFGVNLMPFVKNVSEPST